MFTHSDKLFASNFRLVPWSCFQINHVNPDDDVRLKSVCSWIILFPGNNGQEYQFLLKGHEDLRQDERVMQLFGLVNSLLAKNSETLRRNLT